MKLSDFFGSHMTPCRSCGELLLRILTPTPLPSGPDCSGKKMVIKHLLQATANALKSVKLDETSNTLLAWICIYEVCGSLPVAIDDDLSLTFHLMQKVVGNDEKLKELFDVIERADEFIFSPLKDWAMSHQTSSTRTRQLSLEIRSLIRIFCSCAPRPQRFLISF